MECKATKILEDGRTVRSINRNIVECKADTGTADSADRGSVLIETLWNVKYMKNGTMQDLGAVLIETLWNVKWNFPKWKNGTSQVLIETLWNVKTVHPVPANASCSVY